MLPRHAVLAAVALLLPSLLSAQPLVEEEIRTHRYDVIGRSAEELERSIAAAGPRRGEQRWAGDTRDSLQWNFQLRPRGSACRVEQVVVRLTVDVTLPLWRPHPFVPDELRQQWDSFSHGLEQHELGHVAISRRTAQEVADTLAAVSAPDCAGARALAHAAGSRTHERSALAHRQYDADTDHGRTQGARRPWEWERPREREPVPLQTARESSPPAVTEPPSAPMERDEQQGSSAPRALFPLLLLACVGLAIAHRR